MVLGLCVHLSVGLGEPAVESGSSLLAEVVTAEDRVASLIESGAGRRRLARELGVTEHQARQLLTSRDGATK
jgi:hypothetical protein